MIGMISYFPDSETTESGAITDGQNRMAAVKMKTIPAFF
jgi:hypothetical protein